MSQFAYHFLLKQFLKVTYFYEEIDLKWFWASCGVFIVTSNWWFLYFFFLDFDDVI